MASTTINGSVRTADLLKSIAKNIRELADTRGSKPKGGGRACVIKRMHKLAEEIENISAGLHSQEHP